MSNITSLASQNSQAAAADVTRKSDVAQQQLTGNFDDFLTLFITQLQNQDPLEPVDSSEFTTSLANLSSVEQSILVNRNLEELISLTKQSLDGGFNASQINDSVAYLDRSIDFDSSYFMLEGSEGTFNYHVEDDFDSISIAIKDKSGSTVLLTGGEIEQGKHSFNWDGQSDLGAQLADGVYSVAVVGFKDGEITNSVPIRTTTTGVVSGASLFEGEVILEVGQINVRQEDIFAVRSLDAGES